MFSRLIQISRRLIVPLGWTIFTQILLSIPGKFLSGPGLFSIPHLDKVAHVILFGGLGLFWNLYFHFRKTTTIYTPWIILLLLAAYGVAVEYFQVNFIPNRSFDTGDIIADIFGAVCGYFATIILLRVTRMGKLSR